MSRRTTTGRKVTRKVDIGPFGRHLQHRAAWSARGVDQGDPEQNADAARRLGIEWPL